MASTNLIPPLQNDAPHSVDTANYNVAPQIVWDEEFTKHVDRVKQMGIDVDGNKWPYVSIENLEKYWLEEVVTSALSSAHTTPIPANPSKIIKSYLRIWSTLVYIGRPQFITWFITKGFDDDFLKPISKEFTHFAGGDLAVQDMLVTFQQRRWIFWPLLFKKDSLMYDKPLDSRCVLPATYDACLTPEGSIHRTTVSRVTLHESCCDFDDKTVVFKVYPDQERRPAYKHEVKVFESLSNRHPDVIVKCLGSFEQNDKSVVILEYANGGNLWDHYKLGRLPKNLQELRNLWESLIKLLNALYHLHNLATGSHRVGCAHRDVKFTNILVFRKSTDSLYDFSLKLTDFDSSSPIQRVLSNNLGKQDNDGSRVYCAPEASRIRAREEEEVEDVPLHCDVWSLGAIYSETIVWLSEGVEGIENYEKLRREETSQIHDLNGSGFENCFHDGRHRLQCIDQVHQTALEGIKKFDNISPLVKEVVEDFMLIPSNEGRFDAKMAYRHFNSKLTKLQQRQSTFNPITHPNGLSTRPASPTRIKTVPMSSKDRESVILSNPNLFMSSPPDLLKTRKPSNTISTTEPKRVAELPRISVNQVIAWRDDKKRGELPGKDFVLGELRGREQVFVIDDSTSMSSHTPELFLTITALITMARQVDPDGVEILFTSQPDKVIKDRRILGGTMYLMTKIRKHFREQQLPNSTNMEGKLGSVLNRVAQSGRATSIYIMTDGVWQPSDSPGGGVENPLRNFVSKMRRAQRNRDFATLQFIRFGHDTAGLKRLQYLDDDLPKEEGMGGYDVVDYREHNDNVPHMLIGAISQHFDNQKSPTGSPAQPCQGSVDCHF